MVTSCLEFKVILFEFDNYKMGYIQITEETKTKLRGTASLFVCCHMLNEL